MIELLGTSFSDEGSSFNETYFHARVALVACDESSKAAPGRRDGDGTGAGTGSRAARPPARRTGVRRAGEFFSYCPPPGREGGKMDFFPFNFFIFQFFRVVKILCCFRVVIMPRHMA